jgi:hypothetical protein
MEVRTASRPCRFTPAERAPGTYKIGDWVGLEEMENILDLTGLEFQPLGRPASNESLYRRTDKKQGTLFKIV